MIVALVLVLVVIVVAFIAVLATLTLGFSNWLGRVCRDAWEVEEK